MGAIVRMEPCPTCRSKGRDTAGDNLVFYDDGDGWGMCHACDYTKPPPNQPNRRPVVEKELDNTPVSGSLTADWIAEHGEVSACTTRGYSQQAANFYGARIIYKNEAEYAIAYPAPHDGNIGRYQVRKFPKTFMWSNGKKQDGLFGQHAIRGGGKMIIITEGADDTLAAFDLLAAQRKNYRCVGAWGTKGWKVGLEFLESFDKVVIAFDQDEAGQEAAKALAEALCPGKGHIAKWRNAKDATDLLDQNRSSDFLDAINGAKAVEMGGIVKGFEAAWNIIKDYRAPEFVPYPDEWQQMNSKMHGLRRGEISVWTAGSSIGKTSFLRRIRQHILRTSNWKIADVELEEKVEKTIRGMMQFEAGKFSHNCTPEEWEQAARATYGTDRLMTLDHRANRKGNDLMGKFRYLHYSEGVDLIFLDHVTLGVREFGDGNEGTDAMMEDFLCFVEQTGCHLALISHLRKSPGGNRSWSQGAIPTEEDMKGSGSLYQIAFDIVGMARNKVHEDDYIRNVTSLNVLKCRETGNTGPADNLWYNPESGLIEPADELYLGSAGEVQETDDF